jgi:hypothetical protein
VSTQPLKWDDAAQIRRSTCLEERRLVMRVRAWTCGEDVAIAAGEREVAEGHTIRDDKSSILGREQNMAKGCEMIQRTADVTG